jgi:hypothetical protein
MKKKITYEERMIPLRESAEAKKTICALMRLNVKKYLEAVADEADSQSEKLIAGRLRYDLNKLRGLFSDADECSVADIIVTMLGSPAFYPDDVSLIVESLLIDPFELYREKNKCEYEDILRKFNALNE